MIFQADVAMDRDYTKSHKDLFKKQNHNNKQTKKTF